MAEAIAERVRRYILDGSDEDLRRLLGVAESTREMARSAFRRVGMQEGWHVIDCGCGPIGGLAVMAEMAGPAGRVVGVDFSEPAIQRARSVVAALQLGNVELFAGDIHELDAAVVGGPFDLAYTRFFLMHQPDPVWTLSQIARLLRPGGWVVAQEALRSPPPRSHPPSMLLALTGIWCTRCWNGPGACRPAPSMASRGLRVRQALMSLRSTDASGSSIRNWASTCTRPPCWRRGNAPSPRASQPGSKSTIWRVISVPRRTAATSGSQCRSSLT
jgi:SAM-dependent methyltransferase